MSEAVQSDLILVLDIKYKNVKLHNDGTVEHLETLLPMIFIIFLIQKIDFLFVCNY